MKKAKIAVEKSSGNVFQDLDLPNAELHLIRADLALAVLQVIEQKKLTQEEAARLLGVEQPEISKLKHGHFSRFKVERLFDFLNKLGRNVDIRVSKTSVRHPKQRVLVAS
jgi:predicted XRE-type DNA-binding protein